MSLLMDALRKAEADKKQADATDKGGAPILAPSEEELRAYAETQRLEPRVDRGTDSSPSINVKFADIATAAAPRARTQELALEPLAPRKSADVPAADGTGNTATKPSVRGIEAQQESYGAPVRKAPKYGGPGTQAGGGAEDSRRDSGITETVATAHTVFQAGSTGPSRGILVAGIGVTALIGCTLLAAGFYYFQQAPRTLTLPSPSVAQDVEIAPPKALPVSVPEKRGVVAATDAVAIETVTPDDPPPPVTPPGEEAAAAARDTAVAAAAVAAKPADTARGANDADAEPARTAPRTSERSSAAPEIGVGFGEVRIARNAAAGHTEAAVNEAYIAYVAGDYATAKRLYAAVLAKNPDGRDALLGLAALRLRDGEVTIAHRMYQQVLKRDPDNPTALAALFTIEGGAGDEMTESRLKLLLDAGVDVGYVYFSLGNLYASNARWADAQQAYFEALRNYPQNPDYNYNLAVSLDRMGQRKAALKYYEAAVGLTDAAAHAGFDPAQALTRIHAIASDSAN